MKAEHTFVQLHRVPCPCVSHTVITLGLGRLCENPMVDSIGQNNRPM